MSEDITVREEVNTLCLPETDVTRMTKPITWYVSAYIHIYMYMHLSAFLLAIASSTGDVYVVSI